MTWLYRVATLVIAMALPFATLSATWAQTSDASIGVVALVNPDATLARSAEERLPEAGEDVFLDDRMVTDAQGQVHLMLVDKSSFTVSPNSDIMIDRFVYDPETRAGDMALSAARGVMRFVGGDLSKNNPVQIQTSIGTLGIRGGIMLLEISEGGGLTAVFSFGTSLSFTSAAGVESAPVVRPGFMIQVSPAGDVSPPVPAPPDVVEGILAGLEARAPQTQPGSEPSANPVGGPQPDQAAESNPNSDQPAAPVVLPDDIPAEVQDVALSLVEEGITDIVELDDGTFLVEFDDELIDLDSVVEDQFVETIQESVDVAEVASAISILIRLTEKVEDLSEITISIDGPASVSSISVPGGDARDFNITGNGTVTLSTIDSIGTVVVSDPDTGVITGSPEVCNGVTTTITVTNGALVNAVPSSAC